MKHLKCLLFLFVFFLNVAVTQEQSLAYNTKNENSASVERVVLTPKVVTKAASDSLIKTDNPVATERVGTNKKELLNSPYVDSYGSVSALSLSKSASVPKKVLLSSSPSVSYKSASTLSSSKSVSSFESELLQSKAADVSGDASNLILSASASPSILSSTKSTSGTGPIRIDDYLDAPYNTATVAELVQEVLVTGCLKADNVTFSGDQSQQIGYFNRGDADFPFKEGIVLSTGDVVDGMGPNTSGSTTTEVGTAGDADLQAIASNTVRDAAVLEFDFVPAGDMVTFSYIFASEEYPEYACASFNDVFGFFVTSLESDDGYGYVNKNVAVLPDNSAVSINNVHGAGRGDGSTSYSYDGQYPNPNGCSLILDNPTTLFSEDFSSSFGTNWTFPDGQPNWVIQNSKARFDDAPYIKSYSRSMVSKTISGLGYSDVLLSFDLELSSFSNTGKEKMSIEVYNGSSWLTLETIPNSGNISSKNYQYDISQYASGNQFQVRFCAYGSKSYNINYWNIDNVEISAAISSTSYSDYYSFNASCSAVNGSYYVDQSAYVYSTGTGDCDQIVVEGVENPYILFENIEADGRTVKLTATFAAKACAKYHIKLAVGDVGDEEYDSWVFLEANSFKSNEIALAGSSNGQMGGGVPGEAVVLFEGCDEGTFFRLSRGEDDDATQDLPIDLDYLPVGVNGVQIANPVNDDPLPTTVVIPVGADYVDIPFYALEDGISEDPLDSKITLTFYTGCPCDIITTTTDLEFQIYDAPGLGNVKVTANNVACSGEDNGVIIINSTGGSGAFECTLRDDNGVILGTEWQSDNTYTGLVPGTYSVTVRDAQYLYFCNSVPLTVDNIKIEEGVAVFADAGKDTTINNGKSVKLNGKGGVEFSWSPTDWLDDPNIASPTVTPNVIIKKPLKLTYTLTTSAAGGMCPETDQVIVTVNPTPDVSIKANGTTLTTINACPDDMTTLEAIVSAQTTTTDKSETYLWSTGETTSSIEVSPNATQTFEVEVTNGYGSSKKASILITVYPFEVSVGEVHNNVCPDDQLGSAFITVSGNALNLPVSTILSGPAGFVPQIIEFTEVGSQQVTGLKSGSYSVTGTSSAGGHCTSTATFAIQSISTDSVTQIAETSATLYGALAGSNIVEYGFYYATSAVDLLSPSATKVKAYDGISVDINNHSFSSDVSSLINRRAYYFRAYMKDASDNYTYGKVIRFLSEKRDFSLALDGDGDFLLIDSTTTRDVINDWGASENTFSVDFWMRNASTNIDKMVIVSDTCHSGTNSMGYLIAFSHGQFYFESGGYMNKTDSVVFDQEWHHVACTYNAKDVRIYVDDSLIPSAYSRFTLTRPTVDINCRIGCTNDLKEFTKFCYFNGNIDAMRFWNVALTAEQISELCYDNVKSNPSSNTITCIASGRVIPGLTADNLTASLGFNVMSTQESVGTVPVDIYYPSQDSLHALPFFHADTRLASDSTSFNIVAVGDAHPSPYLPRVQWRYNPTDSVWMNSSNWGGFAYPGQGIDSSAYPDVFPTLRSVNDSASCLYTIVDSSAIRPVVTGTPPVVQILVDKDGHIGTYRVDESASKLRIIKGIYPRMFDAADIDSEDGAIDIEEGSMEAFPD